MPFEFIARNGLIARADSQISGSTRITGSVFITGSVISTRFGFTGSLFGTASYVTGALFTSANPAFSASYALTASYALNATAGGIGGSGNTNRIAKFTAATTIGDSNIFDNGTNVQITGSTVVSGSLGVTGSFSVSGSGINSLDSTQITGSLNVSAGITGSLFGTASWALNVVGGSGGGLRTKAGAVLAAGFQGNPETASISFSTAWPDTDYGVVVTGEDARSWTIQTKTTAGFIINSNSNQAVVGTTYWVATAYGETT